MKFSTKFAFLIFFTLCWVAAHADTLTFTDSGTFSTSTGSSAFSGPGATWSFSFQADSNPTALAFGNGGVSFAFSDFSYFLNGSQVAISPTFIRFFSSGNGGGFEICFNGATVSTCTDALATATFGWPQYYIDPSSAPTLHTGAFTSDFAVLVNGTAYIQPNNTTILASSAVPEPASFVMLAGGLLALAGLRAKQIPGAGWATNLANSVLGARIK